jgi:transposase
MELVHRCCCGLDVHKQTVVACLLRTDTAGRRRKELRTFGTMTDDLLTLADWLRAAECTQVAMESTGVYVRRFTARAIPPAGRTGSEGYLWAND